MFQIDVNHWVLIFCFPLYKQTCFWYCAPLNSQLWYSDIWFLSRLWFLIWILFLFSRFCFETMNQMQKKMRIWCSESLVDCIEFLCVSLLLSWLFGLIGSSVLLSFLCRKCYCTVPLLGSNVCIIWEPLLALINLPTFGPF